MRIDEFGHERLFRSKMTQTDKASAAFGSQTTLEKMNGHATADTGSQSSVDSSPSSISPPGGRPESSSESILEMGSTDSAGNANGSSCGLVSSLFPSSCRGRTEAFARHLHRRLTSLGSDNSVQSESELSKATETSWLHQNSVIRTTPPTSSTNLYHDEHAPQLARNQDTDLYFDFSLDLDDNGPESPAEEASLAEISDLLVNSHSKRKSLKESPSQDDCIFAPPILGTTPESDESEIYFDPLSSDSEKKGEVYFDPVVTYDSESSAPMTNGVNGYPPYCENNIFHDRTENGESSESECSRTRSLDSTSPSHESLWSTFDESTVSQDETIPKPDVCEAETRLNESPGDSELPENVVGGVENAEENGDVDEVDFAMEIVQKPEILNGLSEDSCPLEEADTDTDNSMYSSSINIPGALECALKSEPEAEKSEKTEELMKNEVQIQIEQDGLINGASEDKITLLLEKLGHNCTDRTEEIVRNKLNVEEQGNDSKEEEEEEQRPPRVRRCSSLKTGKTPPGTPGRKKIVRFADVLGLDLADVRTFLDEIPKIPNSAYSDLIYDDVFHKDSSPTIHGVQSWSARYMDHRLPNCPVSTQKVDRSLVPLFQQPGGLSSFLDIVRERFVCLENAVVQDPVNLCIQGTVRVLNLDFHKSVHVRYTTNSWRSYTELQAMYVPNSCDGFSDRFTFVIYCPQLHVGQRLEFAVRFHCKGMQHWDNNSGANYCFQSLPTRSASGYIPIISSDSAHDWIPMFY